MMQRRSFYCVKSEIRDLVGFLTFLGGLLVKFASCYLELALKG